MLVQDVLLVLPEMLVVMLAQDVLLVLPEMLVVMSVMVGLWEHLVKKVEALAV